MTSARSSLAFCGENLKARYALRGDEASARAAARELCVEQTVEFPADLIARDDIHSLVIGEVVAFGARGGDLWEAEVAYSAEVAGDELTQLFNVLFGNTSLKPNVRLDDFALPPSLARVFKGPRFGVDGLRRLCGAHGRPLLCSALKPMGLSPEELAEIAYALAAGGIDIIKDDHGLADQVFCRFEDRVAACAAAIARANRDTGNRALYAPNVSAPADALHGRASFAVSHGAGALLVAPGLVGFDSMRAIADDDGIAVPVLCHPALIGSFAVRPDAGIAHGALYGTFARLAGADATIFPSFGGRFSYTKEECLDVVEKCRKPLGDLAPIFPMPAGGMTLGRVGELRSFYGDDAIFLIGGDLHRGPSPLVENCRAFRALVE